MLPTWFTASADGTDKKLQSKKLLQVSPWNNWTGGVGSRQFQGSGREPSAGSITSDTPANYFAEKILRSLLQIRAKLDLNSLAHPKVTFISKLGTKHNSPPSISFHPESWQLFWRACLLLSWQSHLQCHLTACLWTEHINSFTAVS